MKRIISLLLVILMLCPTVANDWATALENKTFSTNSTINSNSQQPENLTAHTYTVVGAVAPGHYDGGILGQAWYLDNKANDLMFDANTGIWSITYTNVAATGKTEEYDDSWYEYKIVEDHNWDRTFIDKVENNASGKNATFDVAVDGSTVTIYFDGTKCWVEVGPPEGSDITEPDHATTAEIKVNGITTTASIGEKYSYYYYLNVSNVTANTSMPGYIVNMEASTYFDDSILKVTNYIDWDWDTDECNDPKRADMFPILFNYKCEPIDNLMDDELGFNASDLDGFKFNSDDSVLIKVDFEVIGSGSTEVFTKIKNSQDMDINTIIEDCIFTGDAWKTREVLVPYSVDPTLQDTIKYGIDRFNFGEDISGYVGQELRTLLIYNTRSYNISDLKVTSSNPDVVDIKSVTEGSDLAIGEENDKLGEVLLSLKKEGTSTITITSPEGVSINTNVIVNPSPITKYKFSPIENGWSFVNDREGFNYSKNYYIPPERYKKVFGEAYVAAATTSNGIFNSMISDSWDGNCFGMSTTAMLFNLGLLDWSTYDNMYEDDFSTVNSYFSTLREHFDHSEWFDKTYYVCSDTDTPITELIECYQILQLGDENGYAYTEEASTFSDLSGNFYGDLSRVNGLKICSHINNGNYISSIYDKILNTEEPLLLILAGSIGAHAMVIRTDINPLNAGNGWYRVYVYDPNHPYVTNNTILEKSDLCPYYLNLDNDDTYIELNPSENKWRYNGSTNSSANASYWGCDETGKNIYFTDSNQTMFPDIMFVIQLSKTNIPTKFNGTEKWSSKDKNSTSISYTKNSSFEIVLAKGDILATITDGVVNIQDPNIKSPIYAGYLENEITNKPNKIIIPYTNYNIKYIDGDDISIIDSDSVINISSSGNTNISVSMDKNEIKVKANESSNLVTQITEINDNNEYTSAYLDGNIAKSDELSLSLTNGKMESSSILDHDSKLNVYTKNETIEDSVYVTTITSSNPEKTIDDVRELNFAKKISGHIICKGSTKDSVSVRLCNNGTVIDEYISTDNFYAFNNISTGTYTLEVSSKNCVSKTYEINITDTDVIQDILLDLLGDTDGDGEISIMDATIVQRHIAKIGSLTDDQAKISDTDKDGNVTILDATKIQRYVAKIIAEF